MGGKNAATGDSKIDTTFTGLSTFEGNTAGVGAKPFSYSRYYDEDFPSDNSAPRITFEGTAPDVLDNSILDDLTFSDIERTTLVTD